MASSNSRLGSTRLSADRGTSLVQAQTDFRNVLLLGALPLESEMEWRLSLVEMLVLENERGGGSNAQHLRDAIEHLETVLRRLPLNSMLRPVALCQLCYVHTSKYMASGFQRALDDAVRYGRLAREEGLAHGFRENGLDEFFDCYCRTLDNLGVALSHRAQRVLNLGDGNNSSTRNHAALRDLDEAIEHARENKRLLEDNGKPSFMVTVNLASRLESRGSKGGSHVVDHAEALQLLGEVQRTAPTASLAHTTASLNIGKLEVGAFKRTRNLEALDAALPAMEDSVRHIPEASEMFARYHHLMKSAYLDRHEHTGDIADLVKALQFSTRTLDAVPSSQPVKGTYLFLHMVLLRRFALATTSVAELDELERQASKHQDSMPCRFPEEFKCRRAHSDVVVQKYLLSKKLEDLNTVILSIYKIIHDERGYIVVNGRRVEMDIGRYYDLKGLVARLVRVSPSRAKEVACEAIYAYLSSVCKPPDLAVCLLELKVDAVRLLEVYESAAGTGEVITEQVAEERTAKIRREKDAELAERRSRPSYRPPEYTTELGQRTLAMDPNNNRVMVDVSGLMSAILGFDVTKEVPPDQLAARQAQAERVSVERAKAEGKHPNPRLCLMCRLLKPLRPVANNDRSGGESFEWNPDMRYLPFGTWNQLCVRRNCSICRLVISLIAADSETEVLHPCLANVDPEAQGTGLYVSEIADTRERVLTVECNQRVVGHLRIIPGDEPLPVGAYLEAQLAA